MKTINKILIGAGLFVGAYYIYRKVIYQKMSLKGIDFLIAREGFRNAAYKDSKGLWTIGVGHLIQPNENYLLTKTLTNNEVLQLLKKDITKYEKAVNDSILFPLSQNKFDALVSLAFNIGVEAFKTSTLSKRINSKLSPEEISSAFLMWNKPASVIGRRNLELNLYNTGNYS
jgi:lysozyme